MQLQTPQVCINVMEVLVNEEIQRQLKFYPSNLKSYLNPVEVATYALNRLPPLYASSLTGKEQQLRLGKQKYKEQIKSIVRRSLAAVERDPLRQSSPIFSESDLQYQQATTSLKNLQNFLKDQQLLGEFQELSWNNLTGTVQRIISVLSWKKDSESLEPTRPNLQTYKLKHF